MVQTASGLWIGLKNLWNNIQNRVLQFSVSISQTASGLWKGFKTGWLNIQNRVLSFSVSMAQTASGIWNGFKKTWNSVQNRVVQFSVSMAQTANGLWNGLKTSWNKVQNRVLKFSVSVSQTASGLWDGINKGWGDAQEHMVQISVSIVQTAKGLWEGLKASWNNIQNRVLEFSVSIVQTANGLWNGLKAEWEKVPDKVLSVTSKITTTAQSLWKWLKGNWEKLALGALGVAVAIATPWETIAAALGTLWGNATASFGGALGFAVAPILNKTPGEIQKELQEQMKPISPVIVYSTMAYKSVESAVGDTVNVVVKAVNAAGTELKNSWDLISNGLKWSLEVPMLINGEPGTGFIDHLSGTNKYTLSGITDANVTVNGKYNKAGSSPEANAALSGGSFDKKVSMSFDTSGLTSSYGDFTVDDSGITGATSSITGLINAFNAIKDGAKKILKVGVQSDGTPDQTTSTALTFKSGLKKALRVSVAKSGSINSTVGNAVDAPAENYKTVNVGIGADNKNSDSTAVKAVQNIGKTVKLSISAVITSLLGATSAIAQFFGIGKKTALGGIFSNGTWSNIPQYAGGTTNAHGSLFMAGEAGPEIVGHIGGRTEVLNKSQLAATMYSAVRNAMSGVTLDANFYGDAGGGLDYDTMFKAMYDAFTAALAQSNERDREKVALLRTISEKEFTAEVSTASINQAQTRMNRRAGTTIVAVGT